MAGSPAASEAFAGEPVDLLGATRDAAIQHLDALAAALRTTGMRVQTLVRMHSHPAKAILQVAEEVHAQLIAMATHGRHGADRLLLGSVRIKVVRAAHLPVLVRAPAGLN